MKFGVWTELLFQKAFYLMSKEDAGAALILQLLRCLICYHRFPDLSSEIIFRSVKNVEAKACKNKTAHALASFPIASKFMEGRDPF